MLANNKNKASVPWPRCYSHEKYEFVATAQKSGAGFPISNGMGMNA
jgi:hypothetical protein